MLLYCYAKCGTCAKARKWLDSHQISYDVRDLKTEPPTLSELTDCYRKSGLPLKKFFNTSGQSYKAMHLKDKLPTMEEGEQLALLAGDGMLVKRPILIDGDRVLVGFKEADWAEALLETDR